MRGIVCLGWTFGALINLGKDNNVRFGAGWQESAFLFFGGGGSMVCYCFPGTNTAILLKLSSACFLPALSAHCK